MKSKCLQGQSDSCQALLNIDLRWSGFGLWCLDISFVYGSSYPTWCQSETWANIGDEEKPKRSVIGPTEEVHGPLKTTVSRVCFPSPTRYWWFGLTGDTTRVLAGGRQGSKTSREDLRETNAECFMTAFFFSARGKKNYRLTNKKASNTRWLYFQSSQKVLRRHIGIGT